MKNEASSPPPPESRPSKRARKAINCQPCRLSKLKCDRARPCSGCVLRGTVSACYADGKPDDLLESKSFESRIDAQNEINRIRQSLATLEIHIARTFNAAQSHSLHLPEPSPSKSTEFIPEPSRPEMLIARESGGGLYAGPTAAATIITFKSDHHEEEQDRSAPDESCENFTFDAQPNYDLLAMLPDVQLLDNIIHFYFESCTWLYRMINQPAFMTAWEKFKSSPCANHVVLATIFGLLAVAVQYLQPGHALLSSFQEPPSELGKHFYSLCCTCFSRCEVDHRMPSLELIELLLLRAQFLGITKNHCEEVWRLRGEAVSMGTAMGLHRDPSKWGMTRELAERRRWAWWNIIFIERWHAFMFGRPPALANHHFDTQLPSDNYLDSAGQPAGRSHLPYLAIFRLVYLTGEIMDDAVSVRPVPYERVLQHDQSISHWIDMLPPELVMDEQRLARAFVSPTLAIRRMGVQSICLRAAVHHLRFTLHRPFTTPQTRRDPKTAKSFDIAVTAADKLIQLLTQARHDFLPSSSMSVPGHLSWGPFHIFAAAVFFSCQLIAKPDQPGAPLFHANIARVLFALEKLCTIIPVAEKAHKILRTLTPLYDEQSQLDEQTKTECLALVRRLAFPCHDPSQYMRAGSFESPKQPRSLGSPTNSISPGMSMNVTPLSSNSVPVQRHHISQPHLAQPHFQQHTRQMSEHHVSSLGPMNQSIPPHSQYMVDTRVQQQQQHHSQGHGHQPQELSLQEPIPSHPFAHHIQQQHQQHQHQHQQPPDMTYYDTSAGVPLQIYSPEEALWSASLGLESSEWGRFLKDQMTMRPGGMMPSSGPGQESSGPGAPPVIDQSSQQPMS